MKVLSNVVLSVSFLLSLTGTSCFALGDANAAVDAVQKPQLEGKIVDTAVVATEEQPQPNPAAGSIFEGLNTVVKPAQHSKPGIGKKTARKVTSLGNFVLDLRGFDWSVEGADVALEENCTYKSENGREFAERRQLDQRELDAVYALFQAGMSAGSTNPEQKQKLFAAGDSKLSELLGPEAAAKAIEQLKGCAADPSHFDLRATEQASSWTVNDQREKLRLISEAAIENDPVIKDLLGRMHKFNNRSKFMRVTAKVLYTTLGLASFSPTFVAPAAEISLLAFMTATGGPEQDKLLHEMYLHKCLESRYKTIGEEAHVIVNNAQIAALTNNKPLAACSADLIVRMAGKDTVAKVFTANSADSSQVVQKSEPESAADVKEAADVKAPESEVKVESKAETTSSARLN